VFGVLQPLFVVAAGTGFQPDVSRRPDLATVEASRRAIHVVVKEIAEIA
jgi:hypothetical protein